MANSPRYTLRRILQAATLANLTAEQRAVLLATLEGKRAPQGRPSRLAKQKEEDLRPPPGIDPASWARTAAFWRMPAGEQMALLFMGADGLFEGGLKAVGKLAKAGRLTSEQVAAFQVLGQMVADFLRDWQKKLKFHFAITKHGSGRPLEPAELVTMLSDFLAFLEDEKPTSEPESGPTK